VGLAALGSRDSLRRHRCRAFYQRQYPGQMITAYLWLAQRVACSPTPCTDEVLHRTSVVLGRIKMRRQAARGHAPRQAGTPAAAAAAWDSRAWHGLCVSLPGGSTMVRPACSKSHSIDHGLLDNGVPRIQSLRRLNPRDAFLFAGRKSCRESSWKPGWARMKPLS